MQDANHLIWIDLEMTGLDPNKDKIIEIATVITDIHLNTVAEGPVFAIHQSDERLAGMDEWNTNQHGKSGLTERVRQSKIDAITAERLTLDFLKKYVPYQASPMCGNSICQDRRFLYNEMSNLEDYFHYRHLDVSTLKILAQRWYPQVAEQLVKESGHRALDDIYDSIEELKYYRIHLLKTFEL